MYEYKYKNKINSDALFYRFFFDMVVPSNFGAEKNTCVNLLFGKLAELKRYGTIESL